MEDGTKERPRRPKKERKRVVGGVPYSTELVRRKRIETQTLQLEAQTLAVQLAELQTARREDTKHVTTLTNQDTANTSQWRSVAALESERRLRSDKANPGIKSPAG